MRLFIIFFATILMFVSCEKKPKNPDTPTEKVRSVLVYMAADNNLQPYAEENISSMVSAVKKGGIDDTNIIVYIDRRGSLLPQIISITKDGAKVIYEYNKQHNSASKEVLTEVINRFKSLAPAEKYSLILWSHATAWIPKESEIKSLHFGVLSPTGLEVQDDYYDYPLTKSFGYASFENANYEINIPELTEAIPSNTFDYIMFDCCYMGSVEVIYNLRDKAQYIMAAPTEVLAEGFSYETGLKYLTGKNPDLKSACKDFFDYYNDVKKSSATVALYNTSKLEKLAEVYSSIIANNLPKLTTVNRNKIQCYDRFYNHFIYDIKHYVEQFASTEEIEELDLALKQCIEVKFNTPKFLGFEINNYSGISVYIPWALSGKYNSANEYYRTELDWPKRVGIDKISR